jgi:hypothetical protein
MDSPALVPDFGPYQVKVSPFSMSETRMLSEMEGNSGSLDVIVHGSVTEYEGRLRTVRIPLDKGLLGYRVFLIRAERQADFDKVRTLDDLRRFSIGQGAEWQDVQILRHSGFAVETGPTYERLFAMLDAGRFDGFSRSVLEIGDEYRQFRPRYPAMAIETHVLLYYPLTRYFYVTNRPAGALLAQRIETGLERLIGNGTFDKIFRNDKTIGAGGEEGTL